jgi:Pyrimidine reductase, riboflavin biosynthesis
LIMRRLLPEPAVDLDPFEAYGDVPGARDGAWLRIGMVMSADGSVTDERAWTDGLGGDADFRVFRTLRALADGIMIGAATVRTGRIGPHRLRPELRARREGIGKPAPAPIIVVSGSLALDWTLPLFTAGESIVVTSAAALETVEVRPGPGAGCWTGRR